MFGSSDILTILGAKKIIFIGDNKDAINDLKDKCLDVICLNELKKILTYIPSPSYDVVIEEAFLADGIEYFNEVFSLCDSSILVILNNSGNVLTTKLQIETQEALDRLFLNSGYMLHESNMTFNVYNYRENQRSSEESRRY